MNEYATQILRTSNVRLVIKNLHQSIQDYGDFHEPS